ncbi:helix-turn-helix domain-containing protein [Nonomuraea sp. NPDC050394]|uniref:helix-turn-helix domain-containing protein n=1 Tax=Nonomuraea sp. NPDC050394 TaxID=3364363 RepID=UPI0037B88F39
MAASLRPEPVGSAYPVILTPDELAEMLKLDSKETIYQWRRKRTGPPGFRAGRHLRFMLSDVLTWMGDQTQVGAR